MTLRLLAWSPCKINWALYNTGASKENRICVFESLSVTVSVRFCTGRKMMNGLINSSWICPVWGTCQIHIATSSRNLQCQHDAQGTTGHLTWEAREYIEVRIENLGIDEMKRNYILIWGMLIFQEWELNKETATKSPSHQRARMTTTGSFHTGESWVLHRLGTGKCFCSWKLELDLIRCMSSYDFRVWC